MTSVFTIHPKNGTDVVCTLGDTDGVPYVVIDADFNESEREQVAYSQGGEGGVLQSVSRKTVGISITVAMLGVDEATVAARVRTISQAFRWTEGGTIEFKPTAYPSTTLHTYYHYLRSEPPVKVAGKAARVSGEYKYGEIFRFDVQIKAWATSDPDTLLTLVPETTINNRNDASGTNYLSALSSNIKGDAFIPHVKMAAGVTAFHATKLHLHIVEVDIGVTDPNDTWETNDFNAESGETNQADATAWGGILKRSSGSTLSIFEPVGFDFSNVTWKKHNFGKVSFILRAKTGDTTTTWEIKFHLIKALLRSTVLELSSTGIIEISSSDASNWSVFDTPMLDLPPYDIPDRLSDSSNPTIGDFATEDMNIRITGTRTAGTGVLDLDAFMICVADKFLARYDVASGVGGGNSPVITSAVENASYRADAWGAHRHSHLAAWNKSGPPLSDMLMRKGKDYILRVIADSTDFGFSETENIILEVCGLHATIRPFEVA